MELYKPSSGRKVSRRKSRRKEYAQLNDKYKFNNYALSLSLPPAASSLPEGALMIKTAAVCGGFCFKFDNSQLYFCIARSILPSTVRQTAS